MHYYKGLVVGVAAVGLVGVAACSGPSAPYAAGTSLATAGLSSAAANTSRTGAGTSRTGDGGSQATASRSPRPTGTSSAVVPTAVPGTAPAPPVSSQMRGGPRTVAAQFYSLYSASQFAASWNLLSPSAKRQVPKNTWIGVHDACPSVGAGKSRVIKAMTIFGSAAIVTEEITGTAAKPAMTEDVFDYANGRWSYAPVDLSIYGHGSVAADITAAKAAGYCTSPKIF